MIYDKYDTDNIKQYGTDIFGVFNLLIDNYTFDDADILNNHAIYLHFEVIKKHEEIINLKYFNIHDLYSCNYRLVIPLIYGQILKNHEEPVFCMDAKNQKSYTRIGKQYQKDHIINIYENYVQLISDDDMYGNILNLMADINGDDLKHKHSNDIIKLNTVSNERLIDILNGRTISYEDVL